MDGYNISIMILYRNFAHKCLLTILRRSSFDDFEEWTDVVGLYGCTTEIHNLCLELPDWNKEIQN